MANNVGDFLQGTPGIDLDAQDSNEENTAPVHGLTIAPPNRARAPTRRLVPSEDFTRWPSVRDMPPSDFRHVLDYTSLAEPTLPPLREMRYPEYGQEQQRSRMLQDAINTQRDDHRQDQAEKRDLARRSERADKAAAELHAHYTTLQPAKEALKAALDQFKSEDRHNYDLFNAHAANAYVITDTDIRLYDVISWYMVVPGYMRRALDDMCRYYHREANLRAQLAVLEKAAGSWRDELEEEEETAARQPRSWGFEETFEARKQSIEPYDPGSSRDEADQVTFLKASFEARKVRLEHAIYSVRYPHVEMPKSLDMSMINFIQNVRSFYGYFVEGDEDFLSKDIDAIIQHMESYMDSIKDREKRYEKIKTELDEPNEKKADIERRMDGISPSNAKHAIWQGRLETVELQIDTINEKLAKVEQDLTVDNPYAESESGDE